MKFENGYGTPNGISANKKLEELRAFVNYFTEKIKTTVAEVVRMYKQLRKGDAKKSRGEVGFFSESDTQNPKRYWNK